MVHENRAALAAEPARCDAIPAVPFGAKTCQCESCKARRGSLLPYVQAFYPAVGKPEKVIVWSTPREMNASDLGLPEKIVSDAPYSFWLGREAAHV